MLLADNVDVPVIAAVFTMSQKEQDNDLVQDLERRIVTLENMDDEEFGSFTRLDYIFLIIGALLLPTLALILAR